MSSSFASHASALVQRVQQRSSVLELVYKSHERWPLRSSASTVPVQGNRWPRISVLDSSFNPPTLAHLALARSLPPWDNGVEDSEYENGSGAEDYDARLLLLSVRNADKTIKTGDASYIQRLQMMVLLVQALEAQTLPGAGGDDIKDPHANVAVAVIDEPTFVGKSTALLSFIRDRIAAISSSEYNANNFSTVTRPLSSRLTFLLGFDTLERLVAPRYYASPTVMLASLRSFFLSPPDGEGSRIVCARREPSKWLNPSAGAERDDQWVAREQEILESAKGFIDARRSVTFIDLKESERRLSSSEIRKRIKEGYEWQDMVPQSIVEYIIEENLYH